MITCTAIPSPAPLRTGLLRNGNAQGNPNLAPRCGAKNRAGTPCRAPAMPNGRCRLHGGHCKGPRTAEGKAAVIAAHTKHGKYAATQRAEKLYARTVIRRNRLAVAARRLSPYLSPEMAARLAQAPDELWSPIHPSNLPFVQPPDPPPQTRKHRLAAAPAPDQLSRPIHPEPRTLAAERQAARAEAAALAPWREAVAFARAARRAALVAKRAALATRRTARASKREARAQTTNTHAHLARPNTQPNTPVSWPPSPDLPWSEYSPLERELALRKAGLRVPFTGQHPHPAETGQKPDSTIPGIDPLNPETSKNPASALRRIDPLDPEPGAFPVPNPATRPPLTTLTPTKAQALRSTTLANTWHPDLRSQLAAKFGPPPPPGWRIPQAPPPSGSAATAQGGMHTKSPNPRNEP